MGIATIELDLVEKHTMNL